jgi:lysyl-tRNA synthetase class II
MISRRGFAVKLSPYFAVTHSIKDVVTAHAHRDDLPDHKVSLATGGRIIGRRKASKELMFLDLESNGAKVQVMLDHT